MPYTPEEKPRTEVALLAGTSDFVLQESLRDSMLKELVALRAPDADENFYATTSPMLKNDFGQVPEEEDKDENLKELVKTTETVRMERLRHEQRLLAVVSNVRDTSAAKALSSITAAKTKPVVLRMGRLEPLDRKKPNGIAVGSLLRHLMW